MTVLDHPTSWAHAHAVPSVALREAVPEIAREAVDTVLHELPEYVRPHDHRYADGLAYGASFAIEGFVDLIDDPEAPLDGVLEFFRHVGAEEAHEGRGLDPLRRALGLGARIAVRRLTEAAFTHAPELPRDVYGEVTGAVFPYLDAITSAAERGHAEARTEKETWAHDQRLRLTDLLLSAAPPDTAVRDLARRAGWQVPRTVCAVALRVHGDRPADPPRVGPDVLEALHLPEPCLIVPDPEGPGRRGHLRAALDGWAAAIGPAGPVTQVATSLSWAREALDLAGRGALPLGGPIVVSEHMPALVIMRSRAFVDQIAARRLAPLERVRPGQRRSLALTLLACLECGFNAVSVSTRLGLHAQTVRYRLRKLEELFGETMHDPARSLELQMVLHSWLAANPDGAPTAGGAGRAAP